MSHNQEGLRPIGKKAKTWYKEQEVILKEWAEKAACYRWLHDKSQRKYRRQNMGFVIPVIIMSTLAGTANFAIDGVFGDDPEKQPQKKIAGMAIGGINLLCGMITTVANFLRVAELNESHRVQSVSWSKFQRNIAVELALKPEDREPVEDFIKIARAEFDRLMEQSPDIPEEIIKIFNAKFLENKITKPEVCDGLVPLKVFDDIQGKIAETVANAGNILQRRRAQSKANVTRDSPQGFVQKMNKVNELAKESDSKKEVNAELEALKGRSIVKSADRQSLTNVLDVNNPIKSESIRKVSFIDNLKTQIELEESERKIKSKEEIKRKIEKDLESVTPLENISVQNMNNVANEINRDVRNSEGDIELKEIIIMEEKKPKNKAKNILLTGLKSGELEKIIKSSPEENIDEAPLDIKSLLHLGCGKNEVTEESLDKVHDDVKDESDTSTVELN